ncbi:SDR family oxidoreductase [Virgibacillus proomii]|nr:SDR family oxidoreductase [Virgibacillus proomii]NWO15089.1 SDR family oxidoreductase [Virgibacillus sp.]
MLFKKILLRRTGTAQEVSSCIMLLLSDALSYITGKVLIPDGRII